MSPWARMDDAMGDHRKTRRLLRAGGLDSFGLHALAILHCSKYLTDGYVEDEFVGETLDDARVRGKARQAVTDRLEEHGQWVRVDGGWQVHDYLEHNPGRADVEARRAADAERKARGRGSESRRSPQGVRPESERTDAGVREESVRPVPALPIPTQVPLNPPQAGDGCPAPLVGGRARDRERRSAEIAAFAAAHFPDVPIGLVNHCASLLRQARRAPTPDALRPLIENGGVIAA